jgi:hypothetical protein
MHAMFEKGFANMYLAAERCVWCWNEFRRYSNALWHLYGNRGVAVISTVGKVNSALVEAGVARGIVAPIAYINHEGTKVPKVLMNEENILRPYLLKSVAFDYEEEIRFVLAARGEILRDNGGVLISIKVAGFIDDLRISPHLQREEQLIAKSMVDELLGKARARNKSSSLSRIGANGIKNIAKRLLLRRTASQTCFRRCRKAKYLSERQRAFRASTAQ